MHSGRPVSNKSSIHAETFLWTPCPPQTKIRTTTCPMNDPKCVESFAWPPKVHIGASLMRWLIWVSSRYDIWFLYYTCLFLHDSYYICTNITTLWTQVWSLYISDTGKQKLPWFPKILAGFGAQICPVAVSKIDQLWGKSTVKFDQNCTTINVQIYALLRSNLIKFGPKIMSKLTPAQCQIDVK